MKPHQLIALLLLSWVGSSCSSLSSWGSSTRMGGTRFTATRVESVMILFEKPDRQYDQIGIVSALGGFCTTDAQMYQKMQSKAAKLGADAIIVRGDGTTTVSGPNGGVTVIQSQTVRSAWEYPKTTAIAIKYRNQP